MASGGETEQCGSAAAPGTRSRTTRVIDLLLSREPSTEDALDAGNVADAAEGHHGIVGSPPTPSLTPTRATGTGARSRRA